MTKSSGKGWGQRQRELSASHEHWPFAEENALIILFTFWLELTKTITQLKHFFFQYNRHSLIQIASRDPCDATNCNPELRTLFLVFELINLGMQQSSMNERKDDVVGVVGMRRNIHLSPTVKVEPWGWILKNAFSGETSPQMRYQAGTTIGTSTELASITTTSTMAMEGQAVVVQRDDGEEAKKPALGEPVVVVKNLSKG
jgi:hypothetical protein